MRRRIHLYLDESQYRWLKQRAGRGSVAGAALEHGWRVATGVIAGACPGAPVRRLHPVLAPREVDQHDGSRPRALR